MMVVANSHYGLSVARRLLLACLLLGGSFACSANEALALQWLERMSQSVRELNYMGTFAYDQGHGLESLRIAHAIFDGEEYERLQYLDGERREILRRGQQLSCFQPGQKLVRFYQQRQKLKAGGGASKLDSFYDVAMAGTGRIAGRPVVEVLISPRDTHRHGYRLALDKDTGLLMKMTVLGPRQQVLERFQFVEVRIEQAIPRGYFTLEGVGESNGAKVVSVPDVHAQASGEMGWSVAWLPGGYKLTEGTSKMPNSEMLAFSDGLAVFSVFVEPSNSTGPAGAGVDEVAYRGATVVYSTVRTLSEQVRRVTVVGEIPVTTAKKVAQSVALITP